MVVCVNLFWHTWQTHTIAFDLCFITSSTTNQASLMRNTCTPGIHSSIRYLFWSTFNLLFFNQAVLFQNFFSNWLVNKPTKNTCDQNKPVLVFQIEPKSSVLQAWESICCLDVGEFQSTVWNPASIPFHHPLRTYVFLYQQYVALWKHIVFHLCPFSQEDL